MANGYMPRKDVDASLWMGRFVDALAERPGVYRVTAEEIAALREVVEAFQSAYRVTRDPVTRTTPAIIRKDEARVAAELACRPIYLRIKVDPTIDNADKQTAGVRPVNAGRARIAPPDVAPSIYLSHMTTSSHVIAWMGGAKPAGAVGLQVFRTLKASGEAQGPMEYVGTFSRNANKIAYGAEDNLKLVTYVARWINRKGQVGPWSNAISASVTPTAPLIGDATTRVAA